MYFTSGVVVKLLFSVFGSQKNVRTKSMTISIENIHLVFKNKFFSSCFYFGAQLLTSCVHFSFKYIWRYMINSRVDEYIFIMSAKKHWSICLCSKTCCDILTRRNNLLTCKLWYFYKKKYDSDIMQNQMYVQMLD